MKTMSKILSAAFVLLLANQSFGQANTTANATATIVEPISITKTEDLKFGSVAAGTGGTVLIAPDGARTKTANVTLVAIGTVKAAAFTVNGDAGREYVLTLPSSPVAITSGSNSMNVDTFTSSLAGANGTLSGTIATGTTGSQNISVGATLHVNSAQASGNYSGTFSVTVNYY